jgi:hypothetical protein
MQPLRATVARLQEGVWVSAMAPRTKDKVKRSTGRPKEPAKPASSTDARIKALEQERDGLKGELDAARQRIAALEESRSAVASRIDWVIESLNGVVDRDD